MQRYENLVDFEKCCKNDYLVAIVAVHTAEKEEFQFCLILDNFSSLQRFNFDRALASAEVLDGTEREVLLVALVACCRDIDAGAGGKTPTCIPRVSPTYAAIATARTRDQVIELLEQLCCTSFDRSARGVRFASTAGRRC